MNDNTILKLSRSKSMVLPPSHYSVANRNRCYDIVTVKDNNDCLLFNCYTRSKNCNGYYEFANKVDNVLLSLGKVHSCCNQSCCGPYIGCSCSTFRYMFSKCCSCGKARDLKIEDRYKFLYAPLSLVYGIGAVFISTSTCRITMLPRVFWMERRRRSPRNRILPSLVNWRKWRNTEHWTLVVVREYSQRMGLLSIGTSLPIQFPYKPSCQLRSVWSKAGVFEHASLSVQV